MRNLTKLLLSLLLILAFGSVNSCADEAKQTVTPAARGARGESCQARNDCAADLACINGTCSRNDFEVQVNALHCDRVDCQEDDDCCGDKPREAPAKCAERPVVCPPTVNDCTQVMCEDDSDCGDGSCVGQCYLTLGSCGADADCAEVDDVCDTTYSLCSVSGLYCATDADCPGNPCTYRTCNCNNPDYDPTNPICTDPDCDDLCTLRCDDERCVPDTSCDEDFDCAGLINDICEDGRCVECLDDEDCDESADETCNDGFCDKPCTQNEECPLFHACEEGECVERGCGTDTECILAASGGQVGGQDDPRLVKCLPSDADADINVCKVPCENDAACSQFEVCEEGYCVFIGCKTDEECRAFFGLENLQSDEDRPYITKAVCRE